MGMSVLIISSDRRQTVASASQTSISSSRALRINRPSCPSLRNTRIWRAYSDAQPDASKMVEDFGARDPFAAEIETNFGNKVFMADTFHKVKPPKNDLFGLQNQKYSEDLTPLGEDDLILYVNQLKRFDMEERDDQTKLVTYFDLKTDNIDALKQRIESVKIAPGEEHIPNMEWMVDEDDSGTAEVELVISTDGAMGLTMNDFILASVIGEEDLSDIVQEEAVGEIFHF
eukprot:CAMPEP_0167777772 /NCGR_PEP_ID=MMETSP0111_2-20121227/3887_1 /TAXON_ID=91324 /ORGANISM="Lotharella globosa, Strain CCCM811" /LENGTH=228 /DNA_ID=CAMNT_0007668009 /DNA_START=8 /DNA_END=694 /DNA_ORIENTATION=-